MSLIFFVWEGKELGSLLAVPLLATRRSASTSINYRQLKASSPHLTKSGLGSPRQRVPGLLSLDLTLSPCWDGSEIPQAGRSLKHFHPVPSREIHSTGGEQPVGHPNPAEPVLGFSLAPEPQNLSFGVNQRAKLGASYDFLAV